MKKILSTILVVWLTQLAYAGHSPAIGEYSFSMSGAGIDPEIRRAEITKSGEAYILRLELFDGVWGESEMLLSSSFPDKPEAEWMDFSAALRLHQLGYVYVLVLIGTVTEDESNVLRGNVVRMTHDYGKEVLDGAFILKLNYEREKSESSEPGGRGNE